MDPITLSLLLAAAGGTIGGFINKKHPIKGALIGAGLGATGGAGLGALGVGAGAGAAAAGGELAGGTIAGAEPAIAGAASAGAGGAAATGTGAQLGMKALQAVKYAQIASPFLQSMGGGGQPQAGQQVFPSPQDSNINFGQNPYARPMAPQVQGFLPNQRPFNNGVMY